MLRIYSRISVWSMTGMTSVCIGVDFRKASSFFTYADSSRSCVVRSKSQKLESAISDWNQYWMQIESRFFAPFTTIPSPPCYHTHSLILFLPSVCAHDVRVLTSTLFLHFPPLPDTLPFHLYLSRWISARGAREFDGFPLRKSDLRRWSTTKGTFRFRRARS